MNEMSNTNSKINRNYRSCFGLTQVHSRAPKTGKRPVIPRPRVRKDAKDIGRIAARFAGDNENFMKYGDVYPAKK